MERGVFAVSVFAFLTACSNQTDPNEKNLAAALSIHFEKEGRLCLGNERWPIDVPDEEVAAERPGFPGRPSRMAALEAVGLVSSAPHEIGIKHLEGEPPERRASAMRYALTGRGKAFFRASDSQGDSSGKVRGKMCYGRKALDKIITWDAPLGFGNDHEREAGVTYLYKIEDLADWAKNERIQSLYPAIKLNVSGAGIEQFRGVRLTSTGWQAYGIGGIEPEPVVQSETDSTRALCRNQAAGDGGFRSGAITRHPL